MWGGNPAVFVRDVTKGELAHVEAAAVEISATAAEHAYEFLPASTAYQQAERLGVDSDKAVAAINKAQESYEAELKAQ